MKSKINLLLSISLMVGISQNSFAGQRTTEDLGKGAADVSGLIKKGSGEFCVIPLKYTLVGGNADEVMTDFSKKDLAKEQELCGIDFTTQPLCPKLNSTNPGVLVVKAENGIKPSDMTSAVCKAKKINGADLSIEAKFKQSITCSYAPSALAAYHLSRMMGSQLITPVAVVKTMKRTQHQKLGQQALGILSAKPSDLIFKSWTQFAARDSEGTEPKLYVDGGEFLYGALSENVKRENIYTEVSGVGPYETRYQRFSQQPPFKRVINEVDVEDIIGTKKDFKTALPVVQQMADVSNMVILDTLLSQDDRIGNIHFYLKYATIDADGKIHSDKLGKEDMAIVVKLLPSGKKISQLREADFAAMTPKFLAANPEVKKDKNFNADGILVREMVLKDNDCGVDVDKRSNQMRKINAIEAVRHVTPQAYKAIMALNREAKNGSNMKNFFVNTLLYRDVDFTKSKKSFTDNLEKVASILYTNCKSGALKIDLDYSFDHGNFASPEKISCEQ